MIRLPLIPVLMTLSLILGCSEQGSVVEIPQPVAMTEEAVGHYCNMNMLEHKGPKAQIHLKGFAAPVWFSQVRDAVAFTRSPEEYFEAVVVYVNDMGRATNWDFPDDDTWIDADDAWFVIGSSRAGAMGAPETIPFGREAEANAFASRHGGTVTRLSGIPDDYVLGPVDLMAPASAAVTGDHS